MYIPNILTLSALALVPASAAVITLTPGPRTDDPVTGVNDWTLDVGLVVGALPSNPNRIIFEAGGDGLGSALALVGNSLVYYYDQGGYVASSPTGDGIMTLDISGFANSVISIRLDADISTATDVITLTATDGAVTLTNNFTLAANAAAIAGGNDTGFGVVAADLAGLDESIEPGSPDMAQFQNASYFNGGVNALAADSLAGTLYTEIDQSPAQLPAPSSGALVPEPSSALLLGTALMFGASRRRRV